MLELHPTVKLATSIRTDRYHKGTTPNFLAQADELGLVEFLRTVDREAPAGPPKA